MSEVEVKSCRSVSVKRLYTIAEAAVYLGRTEWSVRELIWKGTLRKVAVGRRVHLDLHDMNDFIECHKSRETP
jgi:excisionase family DNA binding protein